MANFGNGQERQTSLNQIADRGVIPRNNEMKAGKKIYSHIEDFTRNQKGDKNVKHEKCDPGSGVSTIETKI